MTALTYGNTYTDNFIRDLTQRHRVIVLGGLAVIAHGFSRPTYDGDIRLDPMGSSTEWSGFLEKACVDFGGLTLHRLPGWIPVSGQDLQDILYLESVVRTDYKNRLPTVSLAQAEAMLGRYSEWQVPLPALQNPSPGVRELAMTHLREFAAAGDPFSQAILEGRELP